MITSGNQLHVSYVHSPVRYAWDLQHQYLKESGLDKGFKSFLARSILHYIRMWDYRTSAGVDLMLANSRYIARRIEKCYGREVDVIYPPVDTSSFELQTEKQDYYVTASRMVPYKMIPLIAEAFTKMPDKKLVIIGDGPDMPRVRAAAGSIPSADHFDQGAAPVCPRWPRPGRPPARQRRRHRRLRGWRRRRD